MPNGDLTKPNQKLPLQGAGGLRYARQVGLAGFGLAGQQKLASAKVLVVGAGGLGVPVLQYLTGMGVGTIGIIDADVISLSNLHRQVLYTDNEVGQSKAYTAAAKLGELNSEVDFKIYNELLSVHNALNVIGNFDMVVDSTDNFSSRYLINDACVILNKPFVYGAVQQYEGHVSVFNYQDGPTYRCLYPTPPVAGEIPDCNTAGVLGVAPGIVGCQQALQVVKVITGIGKTISGYLQIFDFLEDSQYKMKLKTKPENKQITTLQTSYEAVVCKTVSLLSVDELYDWYEAGKEFQLLDVREADEFEEEHLEGAISIPYSEFKPTNVIVDKLKPMVMFCQKGARSNKTSQLLQQQYPTATIYSVLGGMDYWQDEFDDEYLVKNNLKVLPPKAEKDLGGAIL
ncbi:HesA/MoeB/ThiF family protein [Mucilaginibacter terrae]|uniref:Molybdopterin/thiamine biosynthesis adenylyltransferase/rhodanese-related sulfurtransferase n=1 Tax=Mucilaginibacter terrae TaxID=1955052 RepID=A0ABU3GTL5_9SPHI|nr:HesA/MoeB/ThiF family protein [Mucilaginibacter terrae]MDT3403128.1 molybdopterin/thiamine biosynthesis adenylyltransferase/rhodanese-related sulfurtransferase [Mucilaginibacter terrae]